MVIAKDARGTLQAMSNVKYEAEVAYGSELIATKHRPQDPEIDSDIPGRDDWRTCRRAGVSSVNVVNVVNVHELLTPQLRMDAWHCHRLGCVGMCGREARPN